MEIIKRESVIICRDINRTPKIVPCADADIKFLQSESPRAARKEEESSFRFRRLHCIDRRLMKYRAGSMSLQCNLQRGDRPALKWLHLYGSRFAQNSRDVCLMR
jgi:hypothetical protein